MHIHHTHTDHTHTYIHSLVQNGIGWRTTACGQGCDTSGKLTNSRKVVLSTAQFCKFERMDCHELSSDGDLMTKDSDMTTAGAHVDSRGQTSTASQRAG